MGIETISVPGWPRPSGYSNGIVAPAGARLLFIAGQVGWDGKGKIVSSGFVPQFEQALRNVVSVVSAAGGSPDHVVRLTIYVVNKNDYISNLSDVGTSYRRIMGKVFPAMSLVEVAGLLEPGAVVEVEATAALPPTLKG